jgi:GT2 family glycosyltransferase
MTKISTITPCYKMGKYLPKFLEELPRQINFDEIEIVLDHNEPTTEEINLVLDFQRKYPGRLKHIITNPVEPIGTSMNRCIREASGEYLAIWNVDDLRTPDSLKIQADKLDMSSYIGVVHGNFLITNKFPEKFGRLIDHIKYKNNHSELRRGMVLGPFFMFRKQILDKAGLFDEQLKSGADFDLAIRLAYNSEVGTVEDILGYYLDEGLGASTNGGWKQPVERTVIEVRYGITDKIEQQWLKHEQFSLYKTDKILFNNKEHDVKEFLS